MRSLVFLLLLFVLAGPGVAQTELEKAPPAPTSTQEDPEETPTTAETPKPAETPQTDETPTPEESPQPEETPSPEASEKPEPPKNYTIYVADSDNGRIVQMTDFEGSNFEALGISGFGLGRFLEPSQIWVDPEKRILIADTGNNRIVRIDNITGRGWAEMEGFHKPQGVCVSDGKLYVSDTDTDRVLVFDAFQGNIIETITHQELTKPAGLWADSRGHIFISSGESPPGGVLFETYISHDFRRYKLYKGEGIRGIQAIAPSQAVSHGDKVAFVDSSGHRLVRIDTIKARSVRSEGHYGPGTQQFRRPHGLAVDPDGNLYVADTGNDRLVRITKFGLGDFSVCEGGLGSDRSFRGPLSVFVYSPAPVPPPPEDDDDDKGKKKKKKKNKKKK